MLRGRDAAMAAARNQTHYGYARDVAASGTAVRYETPYLKKN
jgi:hypothetical protein